MMLDDRPRQFRPPPEEEDAGIGPRPPTPWFSYTVIGLSVAVTAVVFLLNSATLWDLLDLRGSAIAEGEYWRLFTALFVHGGLVHLGMNMWAVWGLGAPVERLIGTPRFLVLSLLTTLGSALFVLLFGFDRPVIGASGMILGWAGALLPLLRAEVRGGFVRALLPTVAISLIPGVSWQGHLGGFTSGLLWGLATRLGPRGFRIAVPVLLFLTAVAILAAAHPEKLHLSP